MLINLSYQAVPITSSITFSLTSQPRSLLKERTRAVVSSKQSNNTLEGYSHDKRKEK